MTIKAGWMLQVTSWENDGDHYNTKTFYNLSKEDLDTKLAMCKELNKLGQAEATADTFDSIATKLGITESDAVEDMIYDLVGIAEYYDYLRVCESWKVYFIPFDIPEYHL